MAEKEYIERELAKKTFRNGKHTIKWLIESGAKTIGDSFAMILDELPAADVRPVVRARWQYKTITVPGGKGQTYAKWCYTACKGKAKERTNYCPNCGARMEEI